VLGHRKQIEGPQAGQVPAGVKHDPKVPTECRRVTGDVDDRARRRRQGGYRAHQRRSGPLSRRVEHESSRSADVGCDQMGRHRSAPDLEETFVEVTCVVPGILARVPVALDGQDPASGTHGLGEWNGEQPYPCVQVDDVRAWGGVDSLEHGTEQRRGCTDVRLPEHSRRGSVAPPIHVYFDGRRRPTYDAVDYEARVECAFWPAGPASPERRDADDGAPTICAAGSRRPGDDFHLGRSRPSGVEGPRRRDRRYRNGTGGNRLHLVGSVPAEPGALVMVHGETHPAAPAEPVVISVDRFDLQPALHARQTPELFLHAGRLQAVLALDRDVLVVASATVAGSGVGARRRDPVRRRRDHVDRVRARIRRGLGGDPCPHSFTWQGVAHEHHPAEVIAGDAAPAGGYRAHFQLELAVLGW
jgi:hypothetical protein